MTDAERIVNQAKALSHPNRPGDAPQAQADGFRSYQGALTLVRAVYGPHSPQEDTLIDTM